MLRVISTDKAPAAVGPYSQAIAAGGLLFVSGQIPLNPLTGELATEFEAACKQSLENVLQLVTAGGSSLKNVVKVNIYIRDMGKFAILNEIYSSYFKDHKPARAVVEVSNLPKNAPVEIEAVAVIP
ncbi:MAG TPA: Rid family detoxifying hydrolase [Mesotoga infera]|uniref:Enamine/imine deaminase n=1 Tax=Mesotoga infera TaxID=1236046 RepID=A0A7Z7LG83_9BACT|nr:Rid family detoxifying hydrolase [Mesotoga infera]MBP8660995.1 Rid family detoxifying hydrolase [Mesotoga sp.]NLI06844.1 reactive intermediate/imine deaminase [Thermotogaceae bacterium]SSC13497.1 Enamine/imine deaminase [Mesotoga infera]HNS68163.1 Rid family detoxifying hydrolase [Mesotoga infera]HOI34293.1 Rid family detoxifying hydrolase [Mesotoga infera]